MPQPATAHARLAVAPAIAWAATVAGVGAAGGARFGWVNALAASPDRIREGKLWFLFSSAVLVDQPVLMSVVSFAVLAALAWRLSGARLFWMSAFLGQVVATLLVYLFIGAARRIVAGAFSAAIASPDYGVSAVSAAWLGSIAAVAWQQRGRSRIGKTSIAISCTAIALFAYSVRPDLTVLSSEHLVAFALGVGAAIPGLAPGIFTHIVKRPLERSASSLTRLAGREVSRTATALTLTTTLATLAVVAAPEALGTLRQEIASHFAPTPSRCATDWNRLAAAPRWVAKEWPFSPVHLSAVHLRLDPSSITPAGTSRESAAYCRYVFASKRWSIVVLGRWRRGTVTAWTIESEPDLQTARPLDANGILQPSGRILLRHKRAHPALSS